ncbi:MAG: ABC transporter permease subunit [Acidimicrobiales bacterium]|nr:ABC transporter permease subunit [Acidimicrobiales bacterium]
MADITRQKRKRNFTPYMLIAPAILFLAAFFAYPMVQGLILAVYDDEANLPILDEASLAADQVAKLPQGTSVDILGQQGNTIEGEITNDLLTEQWFRVTATDPSGETLDGWAPETRIRIRSEAEDGTPLTGTVRAVLGADADPLTSLRAEPSERAEVVGQVEARETVDITGVAVLEVWFNVRAVDAGGSSVEGWAPSRFIRAFSSGEEGRVDRGTDGEFTTRFISKMVDDRFFGPAWRTTLLLMAIILPLQFMLALVMALVIHARIKATSMFLYVFSLPMGMSDLAVGILFFSIFTGNGLLNSILEGLGLIDDPKLFLSADTRNWIIAAIVLAELWRATSIVMVIVVSGLQAIPDETLEAAELFGASYWQRVRYIMLPLLKPSLQVALILRTILAFQVFAVVIALGGGEIVTVLANETYRQYFFLRDNNVASAYALFILLLSLGSSFFYLRTVRSQGELAKS